MQTVTICLIMLNAVLIGLETDFPEKFHWDVVENMFLVCLTVELVIRMYCLGFRKFFLFHNDPGIAWNIFDFLLVAMGVLSLLLHFFAGSTDILARNATLFRIIRLLQILRVLRTPNRSNSQEEHGPATQNESNESPESATKVYPESVDGVLAEAAPSTGRNHALRSPRIQDRSWWRPP